MGLKLDEIKQRIKQPLHKERINDAVFFEDRLKLHLQSTVEKPLNNQAYIRFLQFVEALLSNKRKYELFQELLKNPVDTIDFGCSMFEQFKKVFKTSNPKKKITLKDVELEGDYSNYIKRWDRFWSTKGFEQFKTDICSFVVIDLPEESVEIDPYFYFVNINRVVDASVDDNANVDWIIYRLTENTYQYIDYEKYCIIVDNDGKLTKGKEVIHNFGFTPVRQFWTSNLNKNNFVKNSPIADSLGKMDHLLMAETAKENAQVYAKFPIVWMYEEQDNYDQYSRVENINQDLVNSDGEYIEPGVYDGVNRETSFTPKSYSASISNYNEKRGQKKLRLMGDVAIKPRVDSENPDIGDPVGFVGADVPSLEFINEDIDARKAEIWQNVTGSPKLAEVNQAINEKQVHSQFEAAENKLIEIKLNFELIEKWVLTSCARIKYGDDNVISVVVDYGDRFFLKTFNQLEQELREAKESGMPESYQLDIMEQIIETKYQNDSDAMFRNKIMLHLEPYPTHSLMEVFELQKAGALPMTDFILKREFNSLLKRFEREQTAIEEYVKPFESFNVAVDNINNKLTEYLNQRQNAETTQTTTEGNNANGDSE